MAYVYTIPDDMLVPGDLLSLKFRRLVDNDTLVGMAINDVKKKLWADPRFDYEGSEWRGDTFVINVRVRTTPKGERVEVQQAGIGALIAVATVAAMVVGAIIAWKALENTGYEIQRGTEAARYQEAERIRQDPQLSESQKASQLQALYSQKTAVSVGGGISNLFAGVGAGGLVVAGLVIYAMFFRPRRTAPAWED